MISDILCIIMKTRGDILEEYLENLHHEIFLGLEDEERCDHEYSQNNTISCRKCGKIK